jgi:hypothetical protein
MDSHPSSPSYCHSTCFMVQHYSKRTAMEQLFKLEQKTDSDIRVKQAQGPGGGPTGVTDRLQRKACQFYGTAGPGHLHRAVHRDWGHSRRHAVRACDRDRVTVPTQAGPGPARPDRALPGPACGSLQLAGSRDRASSTSSPPASRSRRSVRVTVSPGPSPATRRSESARPGASPPTRRRARPSPPARARAAGGPVRGPGSSVTRRDPAASDGVGLESPADRDCRTVSA